MSQADPEGFSIDSLTDNEINRKGTRQPQIYIRFIFLWTFFFYFIKKTIAEGFSMDILIKLVTEITEQEPGSHGGIFHWFSYKVTNETNRTGARQPRRDVLLICLLN